MNNSAFRSFSRLILFLTVLFLLNYGFTYAQYGSLSGKVTDRITGLALNGTEVKIRFSSFKSVTDDEGFFFISNIPAGKYSVLIKQIGYTESEQSVVITENEITKIEAELVSSEIETGEIKVSSVRYETMIKDVAVPMEVISSEDILRRPVSNVSESLADKAGISLTRDGIWAADISIRGLSKSGIVILIDGNRVETANDLSARLSMIEISDVERIEVIKGGASSLYGTGAVGGIVNVFTKEGRFEKKLNFGGSLISGYNSVNKNGSIWMSLNAGAGKWFAKLTGSFRKASDIMTPAGEVPNSQFTDYNFSAKLGYKPFTDQKIKLTFENYKAEDVGIPGGYPLFPQNALVTYPLEKRNLFSAEYIINNLSGKFGQLSFKYFYQYILRDVENIPYTFQIKPAGNGQPKQKISVLEISPTGKHYTNELQIQSDWNFGKQNFFIAGIEAWQRNLDSKRERDLRIETYDSSGTNVISTVYKTVGEKPLPDASYTSIGIFLQDEIKLYNNRLKIILGARADRISVSNTETMQPYYEISGGIINLTPSGQKIIWNAGSSEDYSWSGNAGSVYSLNKSVDLTINVSRSFRSPSLEERYQYIDLGSLIRVGNPYLSPENGLSTDLGLRIWKNSFNFSGDVFYNSFSNLVTEIPGVYEGRSALIKTNIGSAVLYGYDFNFNYNFYKSFVAYGVMSYVRGEDTEENLNLPQIPPLNFRIGMKFSLPGFIYADLNSVIYARQSNTALSEISTAGFAVFNAEFSTQYFGFKGTGETKYLVTAGVSNILDKEYRNFLTTNRGSYTSESGINLFIKFKIDM